MRWSHLIRHGLIGGSLVGAAGTANAAPCDDVADKTIAVVVGLDLGGRVRLIGGIEGRACVGDKGQAMLRLEAGGGRTRIIGGLRVQPMMDDQPWDDESKEN